MCKTIELLFWMVNGVGLRNSVSDGVHIAYGQGQFWRVFIPICFYWVFNVLVVQKRIQFM